MMTKTIKEISNDDLLDWFAELCDGETSPWGQISSLPFDIFETRNEIINRMESGYNE